MNQIHLIGRLTKNPEMRFTQDGKPVTNFRLAVDNPRKGADGKNTADFFDVTYWGRDADNPGLAGVAAEYLKRGHRCAVSGRVSLRTWEGDKGHGASMTVDGRELELLQPKEEKE